MKKATKKMSDLNQRQYRERLNSTFPKKVGERMQKAREEMPLPEKYECKDGKNHSKVTRDIFVEMLGEKGLPLSVDTIHKWESDCGVPYDCVELVCDLLGCDVGYLFGCYKEKNETTHNVCTYTGLSEKSINQIRNIKNSKKITDDDFTIDTLNTLFENDNFWNLLEVMKQYINLSKELKEVDKKIGRYEDNSIIVNKTREIFYKLTKVNADLNQAIVDLSSDYLPKTDKGKLIDKEKTEIYDEFNDMI